MNNMQMQMDPYTHNAFWFEDRITVTFQLGPDAVAIPPGGGVPLGSRPAQPPHHRADGRRGEPDR